MRLCVLLVVGCVKQFGFQSTHKCAKQITVFTVVGKRIPDTLTQKTRRQRQRHSLTTFDSCRKLFADEVKARLQFNGADDAPRVQGTLD